MIESPHETFRWLSPRLPSALVSRDALARIEAASRLLPPSRALCFECRLGAGSGRVDVIGSVTPGWGRDELAEEARAGSASMREGPVWQGVRALCAEWADPSCLLHGRVPCMWLELDLDGRSASVPPPLASCCVQPRFFEGQLAGGSGAEGAGVRDTLWRALELLGGEPPSAGLTRAVTVCLDELPEHAAVMYTASLRARGQEAIRLGISIQRSEVPAYLARIGLSFDSAGVLDRLLSVAEFSSGAELSLDVGEHVLPVLGSASMLLRSAEDPRIRILLDRLVGWGLCAPEKRDAIFGWLGSEEAMLPGTRWPSKILRCVTLKLVHRPGQPLEAKVYLEFYATFSLVR